MDLRVSQEGVLVIQAKDNGRRHDGEKRSESGSSLGGDGREVGRKGKRGKRDDRWNWGLGDLDGQKF